MTTYNNAYLNALHSRLAVLGYAHTEKTGAAPLLSPAMRDIGLHALGGSALGGLSGALGAESGHGMEGALYGGALGGAVGAGLGAAGGYRLHPQTPATPAIAPAAPAKRVRARKAAGQAAMPAGFEDLMAADARRDAGRVVTAGANYSLLDVMQKRAFLGTMASGLGSRMIGAGMSALGKGAVGGVRHTLGNKIMGAAANMGMPQFATALGAGTMAAGAGLGAGLGAGYMAGRR